MRANKCWFLHHDNATSPNWFFTSFFSKKLLALFRHHLILLIWLHVTSGLLANSKGECREAISTKLRRWKLENRRSRRLHLNIVVYPRKTNACQDDIFRTVGSWDLKFDMKVSFELNQLHETVGLNPSVRLCIQPKINSPQQWGLKTWNSVCGLLVCWNDLQGNNFTLSQQRFDENTWDLVCSSHIHWTQHSKLLPLLSFH